MSSSSDTIQFIGTSQIIVPTGATVAVYIDHQAYQNNTLFKYGSGGTLYVIGVGSTLAGATLVANATTHYLMGSSESLALNGPVRCYLLSLAATTTVMCIRGMNSSS